MEHNTKDSIKEVKFTKKPQGKLAYVLLSVGFSSVALSLFHNNSILALIGIAFIFWGGIFLYIRPKKYLRKDLFDYTLINEIKNINTIVNVLNLNGTPTYISPPSLTGFNKVIMVITKEQSNIFANEDVDLDELRLDDEILTLTPSGLGFIQFIEKEYNLVVSAVDLDYVNSTISKILIEDLEFCKSFQLSNSNGSIEISLTESVFDNIMLDILTEKQVTVIDDPVSSIFACIIALITKKPVTVDQVQYYENEKNLKLKYSLL